MLFLAGICLVTDCIRIEPVYFDDDKKTANDTVRSFHLAYNSKETHLLYSAMSTEARSELPYSTFSDLFVQLREQTGPIIKSTVIREEIRAVASSRVVDLFYETEFTDYRLIEHFTLHVADGKAAIRYYHRPEPASGSTGIPDVLKTHP